MNCPAANFKVRLAGLLLLGLFLLTQLAGASASLHDAVCEESRSTEHECPALVLGHLEVEPVGTSFICLEANRQAALFPVVPPALLPSLHFGLNRERAPPALPCSA